MLCSNPHTPFKPFVKTHTKASSSKVHARWFVGDSPPSSSMPHGPPLAVYTFFTILISLEIISQHGQLVVGARTCCITLVWHRIPLFFRMDLRWSCIIEEKTRFRHGCHCDITLLSPSFTRNYPVHWSNKFFRLWKVWRSMVCCAKTMGVDRGMGLCQHANASSEGWWIVWHRIREIFRYSPQFP